MTQGILAGDCKIITDTAGLKEIVGKIEIQREIAVDLEMDSLHHYREKVCLIQISTRTENWLIDALAINDLSPLAAPLENTGLIKVMHGADYDIRSLHRDFGIELHNLFDTMIASRLLGITEFGLAALLKARLGIELDKKYQKADWSKRPLPAEMCAYAAADTSNLLPLYDQLCDELKQKGRESWLEEECQLVSQVRVTEKSGPLFLSCKGAGKLKARSLAILEELLQFRDVYACKLDRPPFKIISTEALIAIAEHKPAAMHDLSSIKGISPGYVEKYGKQLLQAVAKGVKIADKDLPFFPKILRVDPPEGTNERLKCLKSWRQEKSHKQGLEPGVIAPNWLLEGIAELNPDNMSQLDGVTGIRNWQKELYGQEVISELATLN